MTQASLIDRLLLSKYEFAESPAEIAADVMELELKVEGMTCGGCTSRVAEALKVLTLML